MMMLVTAGWTTSATAIMGSKLKHSRVTHFSQKLLRNIVEKLGLCAIGYSGRNVGTEGQQISSLWCIQTESAIPTLIPLGIRHRSRIWVLHSVHDHLLMLGGLST
jgi:hypothetical protein